MKKEVNKPLPLCYNTIIPRERKGNDNMKTWILVCLVLTIPHLTLTYNGREWDIDCILRLLLFIACCIWG